jgi:hypothetical protein
MPSEIVIVGLGPGPPARLTREAETTLLSAGRVLFRMSDHPVYQWLAGQGVDVLPFDFVYTQRGLAGTAGYEFIADAVLSEARRCGQAVFAVPGHPMVFEETPELIARRTAGTEVSVRIIPGLSFLDLLYAELGVDPRRGVRVSSAFDVDDRFVVSDEVALVLGQVLARERSPAGKGEPAFIRVRRWLDERFAADHPIGIVWNTKAPGYLTESRTFLRGDFESVLTHVRSKAREAALYVPPRSASR